MLSHSLYQDYEYPLISVIIPSFNNHKRLRQTLESLFHQEYPNFEILIIDGGSIDRTLEMVHRYPQERIRLYSYSGFHRAEMLNKGIAQASGDYLSFLFPGDLYISHYTLKMVMAECLNSRKPDLIYCGCLLDDEKSELKPLIRKIPFDYLRDGLQPTAMQACWFRRELFEKIGKFQTDYTLQIGLDFFCRFALKNELTAAFLPVYLVKYNLSWATRHSTLRHTWETFRIVKAHYGWFAALNSLFRWKSLKRLALLWGKRVKMAFVGNNR